MLSLLLKTKKSLLRRDQTTLWSNQTGRKRQSKRRILALQTMILRRQWDQLTQEENRIHVPHNLINTFSVDVFLEEFYVEVHAERGGDNNFAEWEPRFLFVDDNNIREVDTITASDVAVIDRGNLVSVERSSRTTLTLLLVSPLLMNQNIGFSNVIYKLRTEEADKFFNILNSKPLVTPPLKVIINTLLRRSLSASNVAVLSLHPHKQPIVPIAKATM